MVRNVGTVVLTCLCACASTVLASAQATSSPTEIQSSAPSTAPVAYVYVSSNPTTGAEIMAYAAAANGSLTTIAGSPFPYRDSYLALNGAWLFGISVDNPNNIDSFSIASNGSLMLRDTVTANLPGSGFTNLFLDHTGASLYGDYYSSNYDYVSYSINQSTGSLKYISDLAGGPANGSPLSFIGSNAFAYSSSCFGFTPDIYGAKRASNGSLSYLKNHPALPVAPAGDFYCPWFAAADPTNHLAIAVQATNYKTLQPDGAMQLATYTADSSGNLTTTSTYKNMPKVLTGGVMAYWMSPSGKFLAVGGVAGLQIFQFNGPNPMKSFTGLLTSDAITQMFWDNAHHLYALSQRAGKLHVYTVTFSGGAVEAPGSPYNIPGPMNLIVLPKT